MKESVRSWLSQVLLAGATDWLTQISKRPFSHLRKSRRKRAMTSTSLTAAGEMTEIDLRPRFLTALTAASSNTTAGTASEVGSAAAGVEVRVGVAGSSRLGRPRPRPVPGVSGVLGVLGLVPLPAPAPRLPPGFFQVQTRWMQACFFKPLPDKKTRQLLYFFSSLKRLIGELLSLNSLHFDH